MTIQTIDLRSRIGKVETEGVIGNSPGPLKDHESWAKVARSVAAFVRVGSFCAEAREGNPGEVYYTDQAPVMALNSLGLPCKAPEAYVPDLEALRKYGKPIIVSVAGFKLGMFNLALRLGLTPWVEVHKLEELDFALELPAKLIGFNNRDLKTLKVNQQISTPDFTRRAGKKAFLVTESGYQSGRELLLPFSYGFKAALVGSALVKGGRYGETLAQFRFEAGA